MLEFDPCEQVKSGDAYEFFEGDSALDIVNFMSNCFTNKELSPIKKERIEDVEEAKVIKFMAEAKKGDKITV